MKVKVKVIEEIFYEIDITPEQYCEAKASLFSNDVFHDFVLINGKIIDCSRSWKNIQVKNEEELEDFFAKSIDKTPKV